MPTEAKRETIAELREALAGSRTLIVSEYRGLTVREIAEIRRALRKQDVRYRVVKNRLMRIAAPDTVGEALSPLLVGPTAIAFGNDESTTAKAVLDATRPYKLVTITGAVLGDRSIDADGVRTLASLPSREVLLGEARRRDAGADRDAGRPARREHPQPRLRARARSATRRPRPRAREPASRPTTTEPIHPRPVQPAAPTRRSTTWQS